MPAKPNRDLTRYYDLLHVWSRVNRGYRAFSGLEANAIHRWLVDPETGDFSPQTIHTLMLAAGIEGLQPVRALDAGCGYGGTMLALHAALGGRWHGITITASQCVVGRKAALRKGVADSVTFANASYDDPLAERFNLVYGIESLIHSPDPAVTIDNLAGALDAGGLFLIVDDMPVDAVPEAYAGDLAQFQRMWRCPVMPSASQWSAHLATAGCETIEVRDLSPLMRPRSEPEIAQALVEVSGRRRWRDRLGLKRIGEAETGGLLLERLGREGIVPYVMIVARKRA